MTHSLLAFDIGEFIVDNDGTKIKTTYTSFSPLISSLLRNSLTLAGIILLGLLIFGGLTFIINAGNGDSKKAGQGKSAITSALIGFAIVLLSYSIIRVIETITGLDILESTY